MHRPAALSSTLAWLLAGALALPLAVYAYLGTFARYIADDYCTASIAQSMSFWAAQAHWYIGYSPRYAFTFFVSLVESLGTSVVPVLPSIAIFVAVAALTWTLSQFRDDLPWLRSLPRRLVLAEALIYVVLTTTPDRQQSLYWQTGMLTYFLPLVLAALQLGWLRRGARIGPRQPALLLFLGAGLLPLIAGGLSETYLAPQVGALGLGVLLAWGPWRAHAGWLRQVRTALLMALAGALLAFVLDAFAPSTAGREAGVAPGLLRAATAALGESVFVLHVFAARRFLLNLLLLLAVPVLLATLPGTADSRHPTPVATALRRLAFSGGCALLLVFASVLPAYYALGGDPPTRALIVPTTTLSAWLVYAGIQLAACLPQPIHLVAPPRGALADVFLAVAVALVPLGTAALTLPERTADAASAARWDAVDQQIRAQAASGVRNVQVDPQPRFYNEPYVGADPTDWFNACVARFYGLDSIRSTGG